MNIVIPFIGVVAIAVFMFVLGMAIGFECGIIERGK